MSEPDEKQAQDEDFALIDRWLKGDEAAFVAIFNKYKKRIYALIFRFVQNGIESEDLLQDVFMKVYEKIEQFNRSSSFYTWLYRIAVNACLNHQGRGYKKRESLYDNDQALDRMHGGYTDASTLDVDLQEALTQLPEKQRATFILKACDDLKFVDVAKAMGCSVGGAKANYFHAVRKLKILLEDYRAV